MATNYTQWSGDTDLTNENLNNTWEELSDGIEAILDGSDDFTEFNVVAATELTIASGAVTRTQFYHSIDTEDDAASDDLTDINGGRAGLFICIRPESAVRDVVVKHDASKINLIDAADVTMSIVQHHLILMHDGTRWNELGRYSGVNGEPNPSYARLTHTETSGTHGGDGTNGTWVTRQIDTEEEDADSIVTLSSNQFTLAAGTYRIRVGAISVDCNESRIKLRNVTDSTDTIVGQSHYSAGSDYNTIINRLEGEFTITGSKAFEIQHYVGTSGGGGTDFGYASSSGESEVYMIVEIWKYP